MWLLCSLATRLDFSLALSEADVPLSFRISSRCQPAHPSVYAPGLPRTHCQRASGTAVSFHNPTVTYNSSYPTSQSAFPFVSASLVLRLSLPSSLCSPQLSLHSRCLLGWYQPLPGNNTDQFRPVPNTSSQQLHFCQIGPIYHQEKEVAVNHAFVLKENWDWQATLPWGKRSVNGTSHQEIPNPIFFRKSLGTQNQLDSG